MRMEALQERFEASREGTRVDWRSNVLEADRRLREELGAQDYERYLVASGRPTSITVNSVMEFSPAEDVGLRAGDQIVGYNGQRVYNTPQLNALQLDSSVGDTVIVDIVRDGVPMQVSMPAGPLGIRARQGRRR
jgi:S1-C subfamily serine protease